MAIEMSDLVFAVREHAYENYTRNGWDVVVEAWDDDDIIEAIGKARTEKGAIKKVREAMSPYAEYRKEIQSTAF